jgi:hypothetical protein
LTVIIIKEVNMIFDNEQQKNDLIALLKTGEWKCTGEGSFRLANIIMEIKNAQVKVQTPKQQEQTKNSQTSENS